MKAYTERVFGKVDEGMLSLIALKQKQATN